MAIKYRDDIFLDLLNRLSPLLRMQMPLGLVLKTLHTNNHRGLSQDLVRTLFNDMCEGISLAESLRLQFLGIPESYVFLLKANESSQNLSECIHLLVMYLELKLKWRRDFYAAIRYPLFILLLLFILLMGGSLYLIPELKFLIESLPGSQELPLLTRIIFLGADRIPKIVGFIFVSFCGTWGTFIALNRVSGKAILREITFKYLGHTRFLKRHYWGYLCQYLGLVIAGGMDLYSGLKLYEDQSRLPRGFLKDLDGLLEGLEGGENGASLLMNVLVHLLC